MKPILLLLGSLVLLVLVFLSGVIITANVIAEPEPHKFAHMDTPDLWTSQPKAVDTVKQDYQRLPPASPAVTVAAERQTGAAVPQPTAAVDHTVTASINPQHSDDVSQPQRKALADPAQADWCSARYKSYRVEDNSYQPLSGGPRRQCQAPGVSTVSASAAPMPSQPQSLPMQDELQPLPETQAARADQRARDGASGYAQSQVIDTGAPAGSHEEWCFARYRSYQPEDNSYQPFAGGPRRQCQSPFG